MSFINLDDTVEILCEEEKPYYFNGNDLNFGNIVDDNGENLTEEVNDNHLINSNISLSTSSGSSSSSSTRFIPLDFNEMPDDGFRKNETDLMLKKAKAKFFHYVWEITKKCYHPIFQKQVKRFSQNFVTNCAIPKNKVWLDMTIKDIYLQECKIKLPFENADLQLRCGNEENMAKLERILNSSFKNLYFEYLKSKEYLRDLKKISKNNGPAYQIKYVHVSNGFIEYYATTKPRAQPKGKRKSE